MHSRSWADRQGPCGPLLASFALPRAAVAEIYFRVTGRKLAPAGETDDASDSWIAMSQVSWWDVPEREAGPPPGLNLRASNLEGEIEPAAGIACLEWTLEFANASNDRAEARTDIVLPEGGAASRLTLWVEGEEREAAYASRAQTTAAYESIVMRDRRDPALLTHAGPQRVALRCFPVPPKGLLRVKVGITAPLRLWADQGAPETFAGGQHALPLLLHGLDVAALAVAHRVITPVSGAVVLETSEQFQRFGLAPADRDSVPALQDGRVGSGPEPATWALLASAAALCAGYALLRRR